MIESGLPLVGVHFINIEAATGNSKLLSIFPCLHLIANDGAVNAYFASSNEWTWSGVGRLSPV
jgi:hypothetical protein